MNKSTLIKVASILAIALVYGTARHTQARWSTTISIKNNVVRTGQLSLAVNPNEAWLTADGLMPNQRLEREVTITNTGNIPARLLLTAKKSAGYTAVFNGLTVELLDEQQQPIFQGGLAELNQLVINPQLAGGVVQRFTLRLQLPDDASKDAADSYANITFELTGEQV